MPILTELRQRTQAHHGRLETRVDLERRCRTRAGYTELLSCFYGFYAPIEGRIAASEGEARRFNAEQRRKTPLLVRDLESLLGPGACAAIPVCGDLPTLDALPQIAGCLYVMEGATLGGQIIARHLRQELGLDAYNGAAFFHSYGDRVGRMWRDFCLELETYAAELTTPSGIIQSACDTFDSLERWLCASVIP